MGQHRAGCASCNSARQRRDWRAYIIERAGPERLATHAEGHAEIVGRALALLARDFDAPDGLGPGRAARFTIAEPAEQEELNNAAADAHGYVDDLLRAAGKLDLVPQDGG